jgi:hypothetical protein
VIKIGTYVIKIGTFMTCYLYRYIFIPTFTKIGCVIKIGHIITGIIPCEQAFATFFPPLFAAVRVMVRVRVRIRVRAGLYL